MSDSTFLRMPISPEEGFPQAFRLALGDRVYSVTLYVNIAEPVVEAAAENHLFELPQPGGFLVMRVVREGGETPRVIFHRKVVRDHVYDAAELRFRFGRMAVNRRNLNGIGDFGSLIEGSVAVRWPS